MKTLSLAALAALSATSTAITYGPGPGLPHFECPPGSVGVFYSKIVISGSGLTVGDITGVRLTGLKHTWMGDLNFALWKEEEHVVNPLFSIPDLRSANLDGDYYMTTGQGLQTLDEASEGRGTDYTVPGGTYHVSDYGGGPTNGPRTSFDRFRGLSLDGTWTLVVIDFAEGDAGSLQSWSFDANPVPEPATMISLATGGFMLLRRKRKHP